MSGILFCRTRELESMVSFYTDRIGMTVWIQQPGVVILKHGNFLLGLHEQPEADSGGLITFFYPRREEVDRMYRELSDLAAAEPKRNDTYGIYHFFAPDPEGRRLEFQSFEHPVPPYLDGEELLGSRRSIRSYDPRPVEPEVLERIFARCSCAPSARNTQPWRFVTVRDSGRRELLSRVRGDSSAPIGAAPMAVGICADPGETPRPVEDGCIAACTFLLAARLHGLGTCWIGGMDRDDVKEILGIPQGLYVASVTPLGYPAESPVMSARRPVQVIER